MRAGRKNSASFKFARLAVNYAGRDQDIRELAPLCANGCGRRSRWISRRGRWVCSAFMMHCPAAVARHASKMSGSSNPFFGKTFTDDMRKKFRASIGDSRKGSGNSMFGKRRSAAVRAKIGRARVSRGVARGERNPNWRGGRSSARGERYAAMQTARYKRWRTRVFKRDGFTCRCCPQVGGDLEAHHIKPWSTHPRLRYSLSNGLTLCRECHKTTFKRCTQKMPT